MTDDYIDIASELYKNPDLKKDYDRFVTFKEKYWGTNTNSTSSMDLVITAHLFLELSMNNILEAFFARPERLQRLSFMQKINIIDATGLISEKHVTVLKAVNKLRNSIAHDLEYEVTLIDIQSIQPTLTQDELSKGIISSLRLALSGACGLIHRIETRVVQITQK